MASVRSNSSRLISFPFPCQLHFEQETLLEVKMAGKNIWCMAQKVLVATKGNTKDYLFFDLKKYLLVSIFCYLFNQRDNIN